MPKVPEKGDHSNLEDEGWYNIIHLISGGDITKEDQVLRYPMTKILRNFRYIKKQTFNSYINSKL